MKKMFRFPKSNMDIDPDSITKSVIYKNYSGDGWTFELECDYMTYPFKCEEKKEAVKHLNDFLQCF